MGIQVVFTFLHIMNNAAVNIHVQVFVWACIFFFKINLNFLKFYKIIF